MTSIPTNLPAVVSRDEWLAARKKLLEKEKEMTHARDRLNADRRRLPMVEITKDYRFEGTQGEVSLLELFDGRLQLIVQHFMFGPTWEQGCPSCTASGDEISVGLLKHLRTRDTTFAMVSRAQFEKLAAYKARRSWTFPWFSSYGSDFNHDFHVTLDESVAPLEYNYRTKAEHDQAGTGYYFEGDSPLELPGYSCFLRVGKRVFHTYSTYGRGAEMVGDSYDFLDLTALGRQEDWEEPKGRSSRPRGAVPDFSE